MVEIENRNEYKVGNRVWWIDNYGTMRWGVIYEIKDDFALIHENDHKGIHTGAKLSKCWPTKNDCLKAERERMERQMEDYAGKIKDVSDLVRFLFDHDIWSDYKDHEAEAVARRKAAEFGIEVEQ